MKKAFSLLLCIVLAAALLCACGSSAEEGTVGDGTAADSMAVTPDTDSAPAASTPAAGEDAPVADTAKLDAIVAAIEAVNEIPNPRAYEDFSVENELLLTMDNIVGFKGDVTKNGDDCALVFAAQVKDGTADAVMQELQTNLDSRIALYEGYSDQFGEPLLRAQGACIRSSGNFVVYVIAGVGVPDYTEIDAAITSALAQ